MTNTSRNIHSMFANNPKLQLLDFLIKQCFVDNVNHSQMLLDDTGFQDDGLWCPRTFDGFACWAETPASATAIQKCPEFVVGFDPNRYAYKRCTENGTWFVHPDANKPWTNYTTCIDMEDLDFRSVVNSIYIVGYSISVATLLLSIMIFIYFRSLQCTRIRIHMHLFTSVALNNILWIIWYKTVVNRVVVVQENKVWCQILHIITNYFMVTSYFWMFCEGLHLHIALVVIEEIMKTAAYIRNFEFDYFLCFVIASYLVSKTSVFVKEEVAMRWFIALGWMASFAVVALYAVVRYYTPGATERCWMDQSDAFWIIIVPVLVSLISSFVFLVNVVRVLLMKLQPPPNNNQPSLVARKAARAALILIPLFGLHFVLIPLRPSPGTSGEKVYQVISALLTSLQGLCVALLFCFTNHDVLQAARAQTVRILLANEAVAMTGITAGESLVHTRDNIV